MKNEKWNWTIRQSWCDLEGADRYLYIELSGITSRIPRNVNQFPAIYGQFDRSGRNLVYSLNYAEQDEGDCQLSYLLDDIAAIQAGQIDFLEWQM